MDMESPDRAMDCDKGSTDWADLGTRILQAANLAYAIHLLEKSHTSSGMPFDPIDKSQKVTHDVNSHSDR